MEILNVGDVPRFAWTPAAEDKDLGSKRGA